MFYVTISHIKTFIKQLNKRHGASINIQNKGQLEFALEKPKLTLHGNNIYPEIYQKAAVLMETINKLHTLSDGNKRTAMLSAEYFVNENNCHLILPLKATRFSVDVAKDKDDKLTDEIQKWFKTHISTNSHQLFVMLEERIEEESVIESLMKKRKYNEAKKLISNWLAFEIYPEKEEEWEKYVKNWKSEKKPEEISDKWKSIIRLAQYEQKTYNHDKFKLPKIDPNNLTYIGHSMKELEMKEKRIQQYEDKMEKQQFDTESYFIEGVRLDLFGYGEEALTCYEKIQKEEPANNHVLLHMGLTLQYRLEKYNEAINYYKKLLQIMPENKHALSSMAEAQFTLGNYEETIETAKKIIQIDNDNDFASVITGAALEELGRLDEAYSQYEKMLKINPENQLVLEYYGIALSENKNPKKSLAYFEKAIQLEPKNYSTRYNIAVTFNRLNQPKKAIENYKKSIELDSQYAPAIGGLAAVLSNIGNQKEAKPYAERVLELEPNDPMYLTNFGVILYYLNEPKKAEEIIKKSYEINSSETKTIMLYSELLLKNGKEKDALNVLKKAIEKNPKLKKEIKDSANLEELKDNLEFKKIVS
ncbi:MAG: tetratricopeptide repeat protein [Thaumarchaeota archaeon]|nr:tetratricopeptide repeat protein [Nitrososphaerota archaeon]